MWLAAGAEAIAAILELIDGDYLRAGTLFLLSLAFALMASGARAKPSRARTIAISVLVLASIGLLVYRLVR